MNLANRSDDFAHIDMNKNSYSRSKKCLEQMLIKLTIKLLTTAAVIKIA